MDMDQIIDAQHELYLRILRSVENLKKIGASKLNAHTVQAAIRVLDDKWAKFTEQHEELRAHFWKKIKREKYTTEDLLSKVETAYYGQRSELAGLEEQFTEPAGLALGERVRETAPSRRTLPRINLPQFSGKFEDWPAYRDLFSSMVLGDASLTKIEQLHYLKTSVKGDAEQLIRNLPSTEENLEDAWELLTTLHFAAAIEGPVSRWTTPTIPRRIHDSRCTEGHRAPDLRLHRSIRPPGRRATGR
ncbi:uncharacterized protein LOC114935187 [Nylanderia fulva]|uniref:uncharacterized protein LOC114935187 n=1 Tax=Nylanderia fulva TaxID=613905 RepID=UPI0010FBAB1A|nr:uncharacterized protein LOC114935187 [Nylanderia fulva]